MGHDQPVTVKEKILAAAREPAKNSGQEISQAMVWS
jgi:hypothetical protein